MKTIGPGVREIRLKHEGQYRVIYLATLQDNVYVLHAFMKKTQKTNTRDVEAAKRSLSRIPKKVT